MGMIRNDDGWARGVWHRIVLHCTVLWEIVLCGVFAFLGWLVASVVRCDVRCVVLCCVIVAALTL